MNTYVKLSSIKSDNKNCNCITPFYIDNITGINPNTGRNYSNEDEDIIKTALYRISNAKGCSVDVCCDANDPTKNPDPAFTTKFKKRFPKILPIYERNSLTAIKLSTKDTTERGWIEPSTHMICKISKASINDTTEPNIKIATNLVKDCFTNQCSNVEQITLNNLLQSSKADMTYTYVDDARVSQSIREGDISYVKEYIRKYKVVDSPLTNDDYNNRLIHIASESKDLEILNMLLALKANINIKNKINETPIHFAVRSKIIDNIDALLIQGVDLSIANVKGETPMFYAVKAGSLRIIRMLYNNNSPIIGTDKDGNNLIHYCIKYSPAFDDIYDYSVERSLDRSSKRDIIRFFIERGLNTEQVNKAGITPLELTQKEINIEINKECADGIVKENDSINELFFNQKPNREEFSNSNSNSNSNSKSKGIGAQLIANELDEYTTEHKQLLEIQTLLFNNVIRNNPKKFNDYISVDDIPKGSPIEVLDTVCVGTDMTGNEDSDECIAKGGSVVKIKNKTTKIKLELIPEEETEIDKVDESELYYRKNPIKIPKKTVPPQIQNYNDTIIAPTDVPQTTGITYNIGETSSNSVDGNGVSSGFNPKPTQSIINDKSKLEQIEQPNIQSKIPKQLSLQEQLLASVTSLNSHPPMFNDYDEIVHKCKKDATLNSQKIQTTLPQNTFPASTMAQTIQSFTDKYKMPMIIFGVIILLLIIGIIGYHFFYKNQNTQIE
jgi:ankyrin repeat protein